MNNIEIRRNILKLLYQAHNRDPYGALELDELVMQLNLPSNRVQSNLAYLSDPNKNLIRLEKMYRNSGRVFQFVSITATGIDLLDDPNEFNKKFPPQVIHQHQHVAGDIYEVSIGDNASEVTVGKGIVKSSFRLSFGSNDSIKNLCAKYINSLEEASITTVENKQEIAIQLDTLQRSLQRPELDLGELQRIKQCLVEAEGHPAIRTTALFSHPTVTEPVMKAVQQLIGHA